MINQLFKIIEEEANKVGGSVVRIEQDPVYGEKVVVEYNNNTIEFLPFTDASLKRVNEALSGFPRFKALDFAGVVIIKGNEFNFEISSGEFSAYKFSERFEPSHPRQIGKLTNKFTNLYSQELIPNGTYIKELEKGTIEDFIKSL